MKIDRLIGILAILLQRDKVTAPLLAEKFEVSRRTINRDIEDLCKAGIPIVTTQGQNGGIAIMDGFKMDHTLLTSSEMRAILEGLKSLDSVSGSNKYRLLMEKLSLGNSAILASNHHLMIDLSSWYKTSLAPKIELIQAAIEKTVTICFSYFSPKGESQRTIEPYMLVFRWGSWYVWGFCLEKQDFRLFKLNRMLHLNRGETFVKREYPPYEVEATQVFPITINVTAVFDGSMKWRLIEEYGIDSFEEQEDGSLLFRFGFADKENLFSWLLSFGWQVELLEPRELCEEFYQTVKKIAQKYV